MTMNPNFFLFRFFFFFIIADHQREYPDSARNPRGHATKFYTSEGNFDLVGLNFPVFFVR